MAHARRSLRNHHDGYHAPGDPLGVYLPPLSEWRVTETGAREWVHPRLGWLFRVMKRSGNVFTIKGANVGSVYFRSTAKSPVYDQIKAWYASLTVTGYDPKRDRRYPEELSSHMYGARRSERNPDWSAIRAKASHYGSRAATGAREAYEWTAPRAKRAAEVTWEGAKSAGRAVKRGAKRAAPVVARGARSAAESMDRWSQTNGRCAMRNGAVLPPPKTSNFHVNGMHFRVVSMDYPDGAHATTVTVWESRPGSSHRHPDLALRDLHKSMGGREAGNSIVWGRAIDMNRLREVAEKVTR